MSITELQEKKKRERVTAKENRQEKQFIRLSAEELERLTEPGHRKRVSELCRELALKSFAAQEGRERE